MGAHGEGTDLTNGCVSGSESGCDRGCDRGRERVSVRGHESH